MSRRGLRCLACKDAGKRARYGAGATVVFNPRITAFTSPPIVGGHRMSAEWMAARVLNFGIASEMSDFMLTREELLVVCWWAGWYGPRRFRKAWGEWASEAHRHLWHGCVRIEDPPTKEATS